MSIRDILVKTGVTASYFLVFPGGVYADGWIGDDLDGYKGSLSDLIKVLLDTAIIVAAIVAVVFLIVNGIKYIAAGGDTSKVEEAQKGITGVIVGLVICLASAIVVNFVLTRLDVQMGELDSLISGTVWG